VCLCVCVFVRLCVCAFVCLCVCAFVCFVSYKHQRDSVSLNTVVNQLIFVMQNRGVFFIVGFKFFGYYARKNLQVQVKCGEFLD